MLAFNRYYAICEPKYYGLYFSNQRIYLYSLIFVGFATVAFLFKSTEYLIIKPRNEEYVLVYQSIGLASYIFINTPAIVIAIIIYGRIQVKMREQICQSEIFNNWSNGALQYELDTERSYLKAITICTFITTCLNVLGFVTGVYARNLKLFPLMH